MPADKLFGRDVTLSGNPLQMPAQPTLVDPTTLLCAHGYKIPDPKKAGTT